MTFKKIESRRILADTQPSTPLYFPITTGFAYVFKIKMPSTLSSSKLIVGAAYFFLALIWCAPFNIQTHLLPIGSFWSEWWAGALLAAAVVLTLMRRNDFSLKVPSIVLAPLALLVVIAIQFSTGRLNFNVQFFAPVLYLVGAILACCLGRTLAASGEFERICSWIALACVAGCLFNVWAQWAQFLEIDNDFPFLSQRLPGYGIFGNINQANHLADYLGIGLGAVLYLRAQGSIGSIGSWGALAALVSGLVLTGQRSAIVYVLIPLAVTLLAGHRLSAQRGLLMKSAAAVPILFVVISVAIKLLYSDATLPADAVLTKSHYGLRLLLWKHALLMFSSHPWLGVGFDQFWPQYLEQLDTLVDGGNEPSINPHNLIAALLSETGIIGTLVVLVPVAIWVSRSRLAALSMPQWFGLVQILNIGLHSTVEYPLWYSYFLIVFSFWLGALDSASRTIWLRRPQLMALLMLVVLFIPLMNLATTYRRFQNDVFVLPITFPGDMTVLASSTPVVRFLDDTENLPDHWIWDREAVFWRAKWMSVGPEHVAEKLAVNTRAINAMPSFISLYRQIALLALSGNSPMAIQSLKRAKLLYSGNYEAIRNALLVDAKKWPTQFGPLMKYLSAAAPRE